MRYLLVVCGARHVSDPHDWLAAFVEAACVPLGSGHASGTLADADAMLVPRPHAAAASIHATSPATIPSVTICFGTAGKKSASTLTAMSKANGRIAFFIID